VKTPFHIKIKAFFLLTTLAITSIGVPLIVHECSHNAEKDIHIFSSEHHCDETACEAPVEISKDLSFNESPCCSFETSFIKNSTHTVSNNKISFSQTLIAVYFLAKQEILPSQIKTQYEISSGFNDLYGLKYRIAIQSFLC